MHSARFGVNFYACTYICVGAIAHAIALKCYRTSNVHTATLYWAWVYCIDQKNSEKVIVHLFNLIIFLFTYLQFFTGYRIIKESTEIVVLKGVEDDYPKDADVPKHSIPSKN